MLRRWDRHGPRSRWKRSRSGRQGGRLRHRSSRRGRADLGRSPSYRELRPARERRAEPAPLTPTTSASSPPWPARTH